MGSSKMNVINDPLQQQKTAAANLGLQNYQTASGSVPGLNNYYNQNFGQSQQATLGQMNPLSQEAYAQVQQDMTGGGGPFSSLKQNLLGSYDAGQAQSNQNLNQQLQAQGLMGSGAGMATLGQAGTNSAMQRALLGSQMDVQLNNLANQYGQQLFQNNQQLGFADPMMALQQIQSLGNAPQFQNIDNTYYTPQSKFQTTADIIGSVGNAAQSGLFNPQNFSSYTGGTSSGNGAPQLGAVRPPPSNYYTGGGAPVQSMMNNPMLLAQLGGGM